MVCKSFSNLSEMFSFKSVSNRPISLGSFSVSAFSVNLHS